MERVPRLIVWLVQLGIFVFSGLAAFLIRFDFIIPTANITHLVWALPAWLIAKSLAFYMCGLDRGWWRFVSIYDVSRLGAGNLLGSLTGMGLILVGAPVGFPRSLYVLDLLICLLATVGVRVVTRIALDSLRDSRETREEKGVVIYGAGLAGITLLREIRSNSALRYKVFGFIDDDPEKHGISIQGVKVLGNGDALASLAGRYKIHEILIALPSATGEDMTGILSRCHQTGVRCRTIPPMAEIIDGSGLASQIRDVAVEDLLGRKAVRLEEGQIRASVGNRVVLVTGAAGSIGSELCRQIARFNPAGIVGFEIAESPLFEIEREMRQVFPNTPFYAEIGSIQNRGRLDEVLRKYSPSTIYHAAAYKHVPMMEAHVFEAVENNVFGAYNVAMSAIEHGVEKIVMISSDKAVRPTSIMGVTKRIAEIILAATQTARTKCVSVRFGNVLGSSGSVITIFKKQIATGGPVTVTHPEMRRFFMTIPEACQLVLQASTIGEGGRICVLDMGEPVKIVDLARKLILLSGLRPDDDIRVEFTGMRPGEKLYEELNSLLENTVPTTHEKIRVYSGDSMVEHDLTLWLRRLREICRVRDTGHLVVALKEIVIDYSPSTDLLKRAIVTRDRKELAVDLAAPVAIARWDRLSPMSYPT